MHPKCSKYFTPEEDFSEYTSVHVDSQKLYWQGWQISFPVSLTLPLYFSLEMGCVFYLAWFCHLVWGLGLLWIRMFCRLCLPSFVSKWTSVSLLGKLNLLDGVEAVVTGQRSSNGFSGVKCGLRVMDKKKWWKTKACLLCISFSSSLLCNQKHKFKRYNYIQKLPFPTLSDARIIEAICNHLLLWERWPKSRKPLLEKVIIPANLQWWFAESNNNRANLSCGYPQKLRANRINT